MSRRIPSVPTAPFAPLAPRARSASVRGLRSLLALVLVLGSVLAGAVIAGPPGRAGAAPTAKTSRSEVSLLGESTWVGSGGTLALRLGLPAGLSPDDVIVVSAYSRLNSRTYFDQAADGQPGQDVWLGSETVASAPPARGGGVWARIPVEAVPGPGDLIGESFDPGDASGVYPLRVQIIGSDYAAIGGSLSTFLVFSANQSGFHRLSVSVTVPVTAPPALSSGLVPTVVTPSESRTLSRLTKVLASGRGVDLSLAVSPQTTEALRSGRAVDRATLARLARLVRGGDELLPEPYVPVSLSGLDAAGLDMPGADDQIAAQLSRGAAVLHSELGVTPETGTWVFDGSSDEVLDDSTLQRLHQSGLHNLIAPSKAVTGLPAAFTTTTYGRPTILDDGGDAGLMVMSTDPVLQGRITQATGPVLAAEQTLAELAMIELETPGIARGVALSVPDDGGASKPYLSTLLAGLRGNPFVRTVTASGLFGAVSDRVPATVVTTKKIPVRSLRPLPVAPVDDASLLQDLEARIGGLAAFLPVDTALVARLRQQLLLAPAAGLTDSTRSTLLASMQAQISGATSGVRLPGNTSVTLTSLKSTLPLTILSSAKLSPHVRLSLDSPKLGFRAFRPPHGSCTVTSRTSEVCDLVLHGPEELLRVPVEARTSGVFFIDVGLTSPDGSLLLASERDTVRSTAVSSVGIVIIVGALLLLGIWWVRDIRSGRRARQLVQRNGDGIDEEDEGPPDGGIGPAPPERPVGPSEPVTPPGQLVPAERVSVDSSAVLSGAGRHSAPAHRGRHLRHHPGNAPTGMRRMSPTNPPAGPIRRPDDPPEEDAP